MSFSEAFDSYQTLRRRVVLHAGDGVFSEVAVALPKHDSDELSFLRLVLWSYAVVQESGRVALKFLHELPPLRAIAPGALLPEAGLLRTWATHNLSLESKSDKSSQTRAWGWFRDNCGVSVPSEAAHWSASFGALCAKVQAILRGAISACELLDDPKDGAALVSELKKRADRNWDAFRFDDFVNQAVRNLGYDGLDTVSFRNRNLSLWRSVVATATDGGIERLLRLRIESDLVTHLGNALPFTSLEILDRIRLDTPQEMAALMLLVRLRARGTAANVEQLLSDISAGLQSSSRAPTD